MIGSEAPVLIAKACEIFIRELTLLACMHTEDNKRRTLQVEFHCLVDGRKMILLLRLEATRCTIS